MIDVMKGSQVKIAALFVAAFLAISCAVGIAPSAAYADDFSDTLSTTSVQVRFGDASNDVKTVNFSSTATTVSANVAPIHYGTMGAMFYKEGYRVVGASSYVTLQDVIDAANSGTSNSSWSSVTFYVYNSQNQTYGTYTKFRNGVFPYAAISGVTAGLSDDLPFYGETDANDQAGSPDTNNPTYYYTNTGAVLALNGNTATITGTATAASTLASMTMNTSDAPRLMWGYDGNSEAGNRFPSNIVGIEVN